VKFYEQAVKAADNNLTAPMYLRKAGLAEQAQGNNEKAAAFYEQILTSYPASTDAREAEKLGGAERPHGAFEQSFGDLAVPLGHDDSEPHVRGRRQG